MRQFWLLLIGAAFLAAGGLGDAALAQKGQPGGQGGGQGGGQAGATPRINEIFRDNSGVTWSLVIDADSLFVTNHFGGQGVRSSVLEFNLAAPLVRAYELHDPQGGALITPTGNQDYVGRTSLPFPEPRTQGARGVRQAGVWRIEIDDQWASISAAGSPDVYRFWLASNGWVEIVRNGTPHTLYNNGFRRQVYSMLQ